MRQAVPGGRGRAACLLAFCLAALVGAGASCSGSGPVILVTVVGLDGQAAELGVVATMDSGERQQFPRQSLASSLSVDQQFGVLLPAGAGGAVSIAVEVYLGDCLIQSGQAPVALSGDALLAAKVMLSAPITCAPFALHVKGSGIVTSRDAPALSCGPEAICMYWLDASRSYIFTAAGLAGDVYVDWIIDGVAEPTCAGQLQCPLILTPSGRQVTVSFSPLCDPQLALAPVPALGLAAGTTLRATWGIAGQEAWAVGDAGTVVRFRGTPATWDVVTLKDKVSTVQIQDTLTGVWGVGNPATLFVVARGTVPGTAHMLQGPAASPTGPITTTMSQSLTTPATAVSGFDPMNVWVVGNAGSALKWNPAMQKFEPAVVTGPAPTSDFLGAWVSDDAGHTLWSVSDKSQLFRLSGSAWTIATPGGGSNVRLLAATGDSEQIYAVGQQSFVLRLGRGSTAAPVPTIRKAFSVGSDANRTLSGVWAGSGYVFAVGDGGSVFCSRSSGVHWTRLPVPGLPAANFLGVYGSGNRLWVVGQNGTTGVVVEGSLP